jgi:hypothetical protein
MKRKFLCVNHINQLTHFPQQAIHCYTNVSELGWKCYQNGRWGEAKKLFGTAYETAEILLSTRAIELSLAIDSFLNSLVGLTQVLVKLDQIQLCKEVYLSAIDRLNQVEGADDKSKAHLHKEIKRLSAELNYLYSDAVNVHSLYTTLH